MAKKDIGKILTTGTARQKILLLAESKARNTYFQEKLLTDVEYSQILGSLKKPNEIRLWKKYRKMDEDVINSLSHLQGQLFSVLRNYSNLRGYILVWNTIENAEHLVNYVLHEIKDPKERKKVANKGANDVYFLFCKNEIDQEGYLDIQIDFEENETDEKENRKPGKTREYTFLDIMQNVKKDVEASVIKYKSWERAILDFMEDNGFNIKSIRPNNQSISIGL